MGHHRVGNFWRQPKTTQERRLNGKRNILYWDEYRIKIRACRNFANLSESRDDMLRSDQEDRSWKRHRKTQWKLKNV